MQVYERKYNVMGIGGSGDSVPRIPA